jgi:hypothetical protein
MNRDHFGYYTVGEYKTYSKLDAILKQEATGHFPQWHFNTEVFESFDWTVEPKESLQELYRQRAQQIRDRYDYIVLFYSGGADSTQILQTFLNHDIKLDEIAQFYSYDGDAGDKDSTFNAEVTRVAIPWSLKITEQHTYIKHRVIDQTQLINKIYERPEIKNDFIFQQNSCLSPNNFSRSYLREFVPDYKDMIAKGIRVGFIWGSEKPRLNVTDGKLYVYFQDIIDNCVSPILQQNDFPGWYDELFFWSPDWVHGIIKQAHVIKRALHTLPFNEVNFSQTRWPFGYVERNGVKWYLTNHGLHTAIYPGWDITTFTVGKPKSPIISGRDTWFLTQTAGSNLRYLEGVKKIDTILDRVNSGFWKNDKDLLKGVKGCVSRPYFIESS